VTVRHLLVTNDFPPKVGGIQSYLWELWRRLPPDRFAVLTTPHRDASAFDAAEPYRIERTREPVLLPHRWLAARIRALAAEIGAELVVLDPALPLGVIGPSLGIPYAVVLHGAEVTVPGRLPGTSHALGHVLRHADRVIAAGGYPAAEATRVAGTAMPPTTIVPPGVDLERFQPLDPADPDARAKARADLGLPVDGRLILGLSRLVPRKGFDVLIDAVAQLTPTRTDVTLAIGGRGRDLRRLERRAGERDLPVRFLGRVPNDQLPAAYASADIFAMLCRNRWAGLEQEGFGIVFVEAAACGVPSVAGSSGGAAEAVVDGETGAVVADPADVDAVAGALARLLDDPATRARMGDAARARAIAEFDNDVLARRLLDALS
jgi:phosphatidylinositol alpha-1,6-mannosyltransferase